MIPDGPEDREWERCEQHDARMLELDMEEQLADEARDDPEGWV